MKLTSEALADSTFAPSVSKPGYDRTGLRAGIAHVGVGNFHRAHQAVAIDDLLRQGLAREFAICGVGLLPSDAAMRDALRSQDGLYTLLLRHPDGTEEPRIVGSIVDYLHYPDEPEAVLERLADPHIRIVSLTITEGGYRLDRPEILDDLTSDEPATVFGVIVAALARRRAHGIAPFTIMSCDNLPTNGDVARQAFTSYAALKDPELAGWIDENVEFPNSMVDRITPVTTEEDRSGVRDRLGVDDAWPVACEPFFQWVLEDRFTSGRPPLDRASVQLVSDASPYELLKLRLLNASHQALAYFGYLSGYRFGDEALADQSLVRFVVAYMEEAVPTLPPTPGVDVDAYRAMLIERFRNPAIRDTLSRLCADTSNRIPRFLLPVVRDNLAAGRSVAISAAVCASWARYAEGIDEAGEPIDVADAHAEELRAAALRDRSEPGAFLDAPLFGEVGQSTELRRQFINAQELIRTLGAKAAMATIASGRAAI